MSELIVKSNRVESSNKYLEQHVNPLSGSVPCDICRVPFWFLMILTAQPCILLSHFWSWSSTKSPMIWSPFGGIGPPRNPVELHIYIYNTANNLVDVIKEEEVQPTSGRHLVARKKEKQACSLLCIHERLDFPPRSSQCF